MKLVWFRRDLRVIDNPALQYATENSQQVVACFVATPTQWHSQHMAPIQADWILRRLPELQRDLAALNIPMLYAEVDTYQQSAEQVASWARQLGADSVAINAEYEVNEQARDHWLEAELTQSGMHLQSFHDKCLMPPGSVRNKQGEYFKVFTPFKRAWLSQFTLPVITTSSAVAPCHLPQSLAEQILTPDAPFSFPRKASDAWSADSASILQRLRDFCSTSVDTYDKQRDFPAVAGTSQLSPYLALGALSVRQCIVRLHWQQAFLSPGRETWLSELIWREFYQHLIWFEPKLVKGAGFVAWESKLCWPGKSTWLTKWQQGQTGYPIVDAAMRQLNETGWMHNRLRMIVASFLTKDLHLNWRDGEQYFMQNLIDGDFAANNGGWQWSASTGCDGQPYFRIFNPTSQGEKFDPDGRFIRRWVPELTSVPDKYIHQPWNWSGKSMLSYPAPMVDHKREREITLAEYKRAKDSD